MADILARLAPHVAALEALTTELRQTGTGSAVLQIVRSFDTDEDDDTLDSTPHPSLADSHRLVLYRTGAAVDVDVDEYP